MTFATDSTELPPSFPATSFYQEAAEVSACVEMPMLKYEEPEVKVAYDLEPEQWDKKLEKRFQALAQEEALGEIDRKSLNELEKLSRWRGNLTNPRSTEEILFEIRQRETTTELITALEKYVEFHNGAYQERPRAKKPN